MNLKNVLTEWLGYDHKRSIPLSRSDDPKVDAHMACPVHAYCYDWSKLRVAYSYKRKPLCMHLSRQPSENTNMDNAEDVVTLILARKNVNYIRNGIQGMRRMASTSRGLVKGEVPPISSTEAWLASLEGSALGEVGAMFHVMYERADTMNLGKNARHRLFWLRRMADGKGWTPQTLRADEDSSASVERLLSHGKYKSYPAYPVTLSRLCSMREGDETLWPSEQIGRVLTGFEKNRRDKRAHFAHQAGTRWRVKLVKIHKHSDEAKRWIDQRVVLNGLADKESK